MNVKILGKGCSKCKMLERNVLEALKELNIDAEVQKVTDLDKILEYNVMMTPALVINEKVKFYGRVATVDEIKKLIMQEKTE